MSCRPKIAILAFEGGLPISVYNSLKNKQYDIYVVTFKEFKADIDSNLEISLGQIGKLYKILQNNHIKDIILAGRLVRPKLSNLRFDLTGLITVFKIIKYLSFGDDKLLSNIVQILQKNGFNPLSIADICPDITVPYGILTNVSPNDKQLSSIKYGYELINHLSNFDIGQSIVMADNIVIAIEALEGTDAMINRVSLIEKRRMQALSRPILVKSPKISQNRNVDLPVIGTDTIDNLIKAGFAGIALLSGDVLIINYQEIIKKCNENNLFFYGFLAKDML